MESSNSTNGADKLHDSNVLPLGWHKTALGLGHIVDGVDQLVACCRISDLMTAILNFAPV